MKPDTIDMLAGFWVSLNIISILACFIKFLRIVDWPWWLVSLPLIVDCGILLVSLSIVTILHLYSDSNYFH